MKTNQSLGFPYALHYCSSHPFSLRKSTYIADRTKTVDGREMHERHHSIFSSYLVVLSASTRKVVLSKMCKGLLIPVYMRCFVSFRSKHRSLTGQSNARKIRKGEQEKRACPKRLLLFVLHLLLFLFSIYSNDKQINKSRGKRARGSAEKHLCLLYPRSSLITLFQKLWSGFPSRVLASRRKHEDHKRA